MKMKKITKTSIIAEFKDLKSKNAGPWELSFSGGVDNKIATEAIDAIKKLRGVSEVGALDVWDGKIYSFTVFPNSCKEMDSLIHYLEKYKASGMTTTKILSLESSWIEGKRSTIFFRRPSYLKYNPKLCTEILEWLKKNKGSGHLISLSAKTVRDDADRYNGRGEDMEMEWSGSDDTYLTVKITTPSGRSRATATFYIK